MSCACESEIRVAGGPRGGGEVRAALTERLASRLGHEQLRDLHLIVSEIVNNSVLHGAVDEDGWIEIDPQFRDGFLRVEIGDTGIQGEPAPRAPDYERGGGFGLFIVEALSA